MDKLTIYITFIIFIKVCFVILAVSHLYLKIKHKGGSKTDKTIVFWKERLEFVFVILMSGLLIYEYVGQFYSFVIAGDGEYNHTKEELLNTKSYKVHFNKGNLTLQQIDQVRDKVSGIVKRLNSKEKVDVEKELVDCFN